MRFSAALGLLATAGFATASFNASSSSVFETLRGGVPQGWSKVRDPNPETRMHFRVALQQSDHALFEQTLMQISTPGHAKYGKHLKRDELKALIKPRDESTEAVLTWLENSGIPALDIEDDGEWINFYASVSKAESMLETRYHVYRNKEANVEKIRTLQYSVPQNVSEHITMIHPTTRFPSLRAHRSNVFDIHRRPATADAMVSTLSTSDILNVTACNTSITPACIRSLYSIGNYTADPDCGSLFGITGYLNEYAKYAALEAFTDTYAPYASDANFGFVLINGGLSTQNDSVDDDVEANLDMQYGASISYKTKINFYSTGGLGPLVPDLDQPDQPGDNEDYLDFLQYILKVPQSELPQTITTSYGENEQSLPESWTTQVCDMFGQLGARGVSIIFSSGDTGVGEACLTNDGTNITRFLPIFPAACPYVTSVGATRYVEPEAAVSFSSGGFSDRFPRPSYQDDAVTDYLAILGTQWEGLYNPLGRGFPDVAAQGVDFHVIEQNYTTGEFEDYYVSGTSASAPTFAAIVSLLNNARLSAGQPPLGFLNPWIYSVGKYGLTDIVDGGSDGCTGVDDYSGLATPVVPYASWNATEGWDPVTGWGTPIFDKLLDLALKNGTKTATKRSVTNGHGQSVGKFA